MTAALQTTISILSAAEMPAHLPELGALLHACVHAGASIGFRRRSVSPPARTLVGEALECELAPGARITYDRPPRPGLEHHLIMIEGRLQITTGGETHDLRPGDCLRYQLFGPSAFATPPESGARYMLFML